MCALIAKSEGGEPRETIPARGYLAVVNRIYDLGTQDSGQYGPKHQILVSWELHGRRGPVKDSKGNVFTITKFYTFSFNEKANLRHDVEAMTGKGFSEEQAREGFNVADLLGFACRLQVVHESRGEGKQVREKVASLMPLDEEDDPPRPVTDAWVYEIEPGKAVPREVPEWIRKFIEKAPEYTGQKASATSAPARNGTPARQTAPAYTQAEVHTWKPSFGGVGPDDDIPFGPF